MSSYEKVRGGALVFKGGEVAQRQSKKVKRKKRQRAEKDAEKDEDGKEVQEQAEPEEGDAADKEGPDGKQKATTEKGDKFELDDGTGFAPDGKKSKKYEELFPVETKRFGFVKPDAVQSREEAVIERAKRKADRYCK